MIPEPKRLLLIRRDNIGDLVCTTPLIGAIRDRFPNAEISALVTRYTRDVLANNASVDHVFDYTKSKHLEPGESLIGNYVSQAKLLLDLRRQSFDCCVLAAPGYQTRALPIARWIAARNVVGFVNPGEKHSAVISLPIPWTPDANLTETEDVWRLAPAFGIEGGPGSLRVAPDPSLRDMLNAKIAPLRQLPGRIIGIHLSARKPSQRWPASRFSELLRLLHDRHKCRFILFWAPGPESDPRHPGDDEKAAVVISDLRAIPFVALPTKHLRELIAGISLCDDFICADGGAMHLAAALGKRLVCLFGKSNAVRWRPWSAEHRLLQMPSQEVMDIGIHSVADAYSDLMSAAGLLHH